MKKRILAGALLCALLLTLCVFSFPAASAAAEDAPDDLPDVDITSWEFKLCNAYNSIAQYRPDYGGIEGQGVDPRIVEPTLNFLRDARAAGFTAYIAYGYRNPEWLTTHYMMTFGACGRDPILTAKTFQGVGVNEHQTGLAVDFTDVSWRSATYDEFQDPEIFDTALFAWLAEHCTDYGFVLRYPAEKASFYGVACPHAHFRYVGVEAAKYMKEHDLCLEEFIMLYDPDLVFFPENGLFA